MYLRHRVVRKNGKKHTYWSLVKSVRIGKKVVQETVAELGALDRAGQERALALAHKLGGDVAQPGLFDPPIEHEVAPIRLNGVKLERVRRFGDVWLGTKLWRMAKLDQFFEEHLPKGQEDIPWAVMAELSTIARLCEPSSDLHIAEDWLRKTALADLLGIDETLVNDDRLYRSLDEVLPLKVELEQHLKRQWEGLFDIHYDLLLYDVTSTYVEGEAKKNPQAKRGHSRDKRPDCKQVCIGLVVAKGGYPLGYEQFAGNIHDSQTVRQIVEMMEARYGKADRIWVWDRGMQSEELLPWMRQGGRRYVVATPKSELKKHMAALKDPARWKTIQERGVEVRYSLSSDPDSQDVFLVCRSEQRRAKEAAMHARFAERIEAGLQSLERRLRNAQKSADQKQALKQIGRLLQRNQRAAKLFDIRCDTVQDRPSGLRVTWSRHPEEQAWAELTEGCYVLRSNIRDWKEEDIWQVYIQLTHVEAAFRIHKDELDMRPLYHQKEDRVKAHIFVCFLAFVLWKIIEQWQSRAGLGNSPRTILEELGSITIGDVLLPTTTGEQIRLRCVTRPEKGQALLLQRLGIVLPHRLRVPEGLPNMPKM